MIALDQIRTIDDYLRGYGKTLGAVASRSLKPLHTPGVDPLPDFSDIEAHNPGRMPMEAQAHVLTAAAKMLDAYGSGFVNGEMGVGKSIIGCLAVHIHAKMRQGETPAYRCVVLCPDHLIDKWESEITTTIPGARAIKFGSWKEVVHLYWKHRSEAKGKNGKALWVPPSGPEFLLLGRNQVKWTPVTAGITKPMNGFGDRPTGRLSQAKIPVDKEMVRDDKGAAVKGADGRARHRFITADGVRCPCCGKVARNRKGEVLGPGELEKKTHECEGLYLQEVAPENGVTPPRLERIYHGDIDTAKSDNDPILLTLLADMKEGKRLKYKGREFVVARCGEPLWQWTDKPKRWAPAWFISQKMKRYFQYLIVDEVHEQKGGDDVAHANACGALMGAARWTLCLTGTMIGGYASDLFALMCRMGWPNVFEEGLKWKDSRAFAEKYGMIETTRSTRCGGESSGKSGRSSRTVSARNDGESIRKTEAPGIMPTLYPTHLIGRSVYLSLDQMAEELPKFVEYVANVPEVKTDDADWDATYKDNYFPVSVDMDEDLYAEYRRVEAIMEAANRDLLIKGSAKFLGAFLVTSLQYPDRPFDWTHSPQVAHAIDKAIREGSQVDPSMFGTVGYWQDGVTDKLSDWRGVVTPAHLSPDVIRPKERTLIDICKHHRARGNQAWVFCQMTDKRDVRPRLERLLKEAGLRARILRSKDAKLTDRMAWIEKHGKDYDVILSHPKLVSTGLDLFSKKEGGHNFNVIVFYQTGYSMFDLRQASRRAFRLSQPKECFVYYLSYRHTMQQRAIQLMARKAEAALNLDGDFSAEGLAGMSAGDGAMALVKELASAMDDADMQRSWGKVNSGGGGRLRRAAAATVRIHEPDPVVDVEPEELPPLLPPLLPPPPETRKAVAAALDEVDWDYEEDWEDDEPWDNPLDEPSAGAEPTLAELRARMAALQEEMRKKMEALGL